MPYSMPEIAGKRVLITAGPTQEQLTLLGTLVIGQQEKWVLLWLRRQI